VLWLPAADKTDAADRPAGLAACPLVRRPFMSAGAYGAPARAHAGPRRRARWLCAAPRQPQGRPGRHPGFPKPACAAMDAGVEVELVRHRGGDAPAVPAELGQRLAGAPRFLAALYQFSRPHTMLGTFISIVSVSALAVVRAPGRACPPCVRTVWPWLGRLWPVGVRPSRPGCYAAPCRHTQCCRRCVRLQYVGVVWPPLCSAHLLPVAWQGPDAVSRRALWGLLTALVPALLMNICIVGINQIFDVAIDKVRCPLLWQ
jgi:hypothetical protein